jgi:Methionine synthase I (cobalamin-dependent), methyltransferase domain
MNEPLLEMLHERILVLDGAMGTMIQQAGLEEQDFRGTLFADHPTDLKGNNDILCLTRPDLITDIHCQYIDAGADIIETNSFNATNISQMEYQLADQACAINKAAAEVARKAADQYKRRIFVAGA